MKGSQQLVTVQRPLHCNGLCGLSDRKKKMQQVSSYCAPKSLGLFLPGFGTHSVHLRGGESNVKSLPLAPGTAVVSGKTRKAGTELGQWPLELHNGDFPGRKPGWVTQQEFVNSPLPPTAPQKNNQAPDADKNSFYVIRIKNTFIQKYNNLAKNNFK